MTTVAELAGFAESVTFDDLSANAVEELEKRVLDSVGIAVGAMDAETSAAVRATVTEDGTGGPCRLWGTDHRVGPSDAAMYNTTLTRYLDFMDSFLAPGETPHPSDNVGAVVACAEREGASGSDLLAALGVAYEVQGELAWNAPVRDRGWDHVTHTVVSAACGAGSVTDLSGERMENAVGIAGVAHNALRVTRTGGINEWKGVASANAARNAVYATRLAANGVEGPRDLFEGQKGWMQVISGDFDVDLSRECERVFDVMTKRYVAETYAQSAVEAVIDIADEYDVDPERVTGIHLDTFAGAKLIIGGGEGSRYEVETKAQADHSLPYMLAAALCDRELGVEAYESARIRRDDVQRLLREVEVESDDELTERFEAGEMPAVVDVALDDGTVYRAEKSNFRGHPTDPMTWDDVEAKFHDLTRDRYDEARRAEIVETVKTLPERDVADLTELLD